ncbi:signal peptidase I [Thermoanaerobacterium sp. RBIITD]|uniref:signal peptidase I n=1 Tax=Thermoanaerobacterium sp. RBIITD TaxID=1550240 RepID=UPI000BB6C8B1|nr:signal peptidase I [Thermoanaerobacterium sp. RBIITD]SNX53660.1 signal peptidase I [Thermoanaerobacterium sp. RBIITD]
MGKLKFTKSEEKKSFKRETFEWILTLFIALAVSILLKSTAFAMVQVKGSSMENTLLNGQKLFEIRLIYNFTEPKRGDIIIFNKKEKSNGIVSNIILELKETYNNIIGFQDDNILIKRVIGVQGDKIDIKDGYVYVNGVKQNEHYVKGRTYPNDLTFPLVVPKGKVFVMGDNREVSLDSRIIGFIDYKQIEGKVLYRIWPLDKIGSIYSNN